MLDGSTGGDFDITFSESHSTDDGSDDASDTNGSDDAGNTGGSVDTINGLTIDEHIQAGGDKKELLDNWRDNYAGKSSDELVLNPPESSDDGTGNSGSGSGDNGSGDNGNGDNENGDNENGDNENGDNENGDNENGDNGQGGPNQNDDAPNTDEAQKVKSPIIIDMNDNGVQTSTNTVYFDHAGDGFAERTGWADKHDALLAWDRNANGRIDDGGELFGNSTVVAGDKQLANNGFQALQALDSNADGVLSADDEAWANLQLWQDKNQNAITDEGELSALSASEIVEIDLDYKTHSKTDSQGNLHRETSQVTWQDGHQSNAVDVWFQTNPAFRLDKNAEAVSDDIQALPNAVGFGVVSDLHHSMQNDSTLKQLVENYIATAPEARTSEQLNELIYQWTGSAGVDPNSRDPKSHYGHVMDARMLVSLEKLTGHDYLGTWCWGERDPNPHGRAAPLLISA